MRKATWVVSCFVMWVAVLHAVDEQPLNVKPGLWQVDYNVKYSGLPPQAQAMMDQMTAQQKSAMGLDVPKNYKMCVTQKNINTGWTKGDNNCRWKVVKSTGSDLELQGTSCKAGKNQGGDSDLNLKVHAVDSEHVKAAMHGTANGPGYNATLDGNYTGTWMSASCPADLK